MKPLTRDGVNGRDFVGVFFGEFSDTFSRKEAPTLSHRGDGSPLSFLLLLLLAGPWLGLDALTGLSESTALGPN